MSTHTNYSNKLLGFFRKLDTNNDGYVSYKEFVVHVQTTENARKHLTQEKADEFAKLFEKQWNTYWLPKAEDRNGDKVVVTDKWITVDLRSEEGKQGMTQMSEAFFDGIDADRDGYIDLHEFEAYYKCLNIDKSNARHGFVLLNKNKDGKISREEYIDGMVGYFCTDSEEYNRLFGPVDAYPVALVINPTNN